MPDNHDVSRGPNRLIIVTGVPGCGKDFLISRLIDSWSENTRLRVINFGEELYHYLSREHHLSLRDRDDLRTALTYEQLKRGTAAVADRVLASQPALVNSHVLYRQNGGLQVIPEIERLLRPLTYVYVWAQPEQIEAWRAIDTTRSRPRETALDISLHQDLYVDVVSIIARHIGSRFLLIKNDDVNLEQNIETIDRECALLLDENFFKVREKIIAS